ncbi:hypothetical protein BV25DRAFT_837905 [Artomyces pyxidatus]|uniref:Uncharacterized protein n=1 Tax=Artomyces pyxidatus TaxID=48021 RepID=A0ACB8TGT8_9AGAM|nr:hypothetical protein BV25DRAFT_837905 [Artomyces pyxidatus]
MLLLTDAVTRSRAAAADSFWSCHALQPAGPAQISMPHAYARRVPSSSHQSRAYI